MRIYSNTCARVGRELNSLCHYGLPQRLSFYLSRVVSSHSRVRQNCPWASTLLTEEEHRLTFWIRLYKPCRGRGCQGSLFGTPLMYYTHACTFPDNLYLLSDFHYPLTKITSSTPNPKTVIEIWKKIHGLHFIFELHFLNELCLCHIYGLHVL